MEEQKTSVSVKFDENKIVDAILLLIKIGVDKEQMTTLSNNEIIDLGLYTIISTCKAIIEAVRDEEKGKHIVSEFLMRSNLKYLVRLN
jgi:hypothetical protein